jgi:hypothetical protein
MVGSDEEANNFTPKADDKVENLAMGMHADFALSVIDFVHDEEEEKHTTKCMHSYFH